MPRLVNLTPHRLNVLDEHGTTLLDIPAALFPARIQQAVLEQQPIGSTGVPVRTIAYGEPVDLPEPQRDTLLVVSRVVAQRLARSDLLFPDEDIRDDHGRVIACRALARFAPEL